MPLPPPLLAELTHREYYMGPKPWLSACSAHPTFVTTEALVADVIEGALRKSGSRYPIPLDLTDVPGVYPIKVPTFIDRRAAADRRGRERVSQLAREILTANEQALVISDGTSGGARRAVVSGREGKERVGGKGRPRDCDLPGAGEVRRTERGGAVARDPRRRRSALPGPDRPGGWPQPSFPPVDNARHEDGGPHLAPSLE
jgi:hypothetical protein